MSFQETVTGMVLAVAPVGEFDKRLVILTKEKGKITVFARGARKPTSQYLACSQPFAYGKFIVYEGKNAYTLNGADIEEYFVELRNDLELVSYGLYFCEVAQYYVMENQPANDILELMIITLKNMLKNILPLDMIKSIFELKMAALNGEAPVPYECVSCHESTQLAGISFTAGGAVCREHEKQYKDVIHMKPAALYAVYYVICSSTEKIYSFKLEEEAAVDFTYYVTRYMKKFVNKEFTTLEMLRI